MIATFIGNLLLEHGLQILVGCLALFGAKKLKDAVLGGPKPQGDELAQAIIRNHQAAVWAGSATSKEAADAALDALADADRK